MEITFIETTTNNFETSNMSSQQQEVRKMRKYQEEADDAIYNELVINDNNKCIVKMFCGTGKSLIMRNCRMAQDKKLVVYVFPSLNLIEQFCCDYLKGNKNVLKISSEKESTTNSSVIQKFLSKLVNKIICVTYQSLETLLENLGTRKINLGIFDEAHHAVAPTYQKYIFDTDVYEKQVFFTATPKDDNGIVMCCKDGGMCGKMVYEYSYLNGLSEGYLNPFKIHINYSTEKTNKTHYESIARTMLASGNTRCLTFHSDVNTESDTSVKNFVDEIEFRQAFEKVRQSEFPEISKKRYKKITMVPLHSDIKPEERKKILLRFDQTTDDQVFVISSCETIGEGIDTKNANMLVFIDPKSSFVKIVQNIGRVVRPQQKNSTILISCWVDKEKYAECDDKEKRDEVIQQDMAQGGNFNMILNVMSALKQEDEELYDICLHYPDMFSPREIDDNLKAQGYEIGEQVGDGNLTETLEHLLDTDDLNDGDEYEEDEEMLQRVAEDNDVCIEVHTNSLDKPVERYNPDCEKIVRLYKDTDDTDDDETIYRPITKMDGGSKKTTDKIREPSRNNRINVSVHTNPDVKVLWKITDGIDLTKDVCSCVIDCEVVDNWFENLEEMKKFIDENNRLPNRSIIEEKKLGLWLNTQKTNYRKKRYNMKNEEKYNLWSNFLEEYKEYFTTKDEIWFEKFEELKNFVVKNKRTPSHKIKEEKWLFNWISSNKNNYKKCKKCMKNEEIYSLWTKFIEEYKEYFTTKDEIWLEKFEELKKFMDDNGRTPRYKCTEEKNIGKWLSTNQQTYNNNKMTKDRYNLWVEFLEKYKEYLKKKDKIWLDKFEELKLFINNNKKRPTNKSKNQKEKNIGEFLSTNQQTYKNNKMTKDRYNLWVEFLEKYKEYFTTDNELWFEKFEELKLFINNNKKLPKETLQNQKESSLRRWFYNQKQYYKKKTLSENRYNLWTVFLEKYKEYFTDDNSDTQSVVSSVPEVKEEKQEKKKSMKLNLTPNKETQEQKRERVKSAISVLHQKYKTMNSATLSQLFKDDSHLWSEYHAIAEQNEQSFPEDDIPRNRVIQELDKIKTKKGGKQVVDMGCGKAQIADYFKDDPRFHFINYDHIACSENVSACDISQIPLEDDSVEICVLSLAMWGSNCREYVAEAYRILESNGQLYIIEPTKRWTDHDKMNPAERLKMLLKENNFNITQENIDKFSFFVCNKPIN